MKKLFFCALLGLIWIPIRAQKVSDAFQSFLLPSSSHVAALGGEDITLLEDNLNNALQNPALLSCVSSKTISLSYMNYMAGVHVGSAAYSFTGKKRCTWGFVGRYVNYGKMDWTDEQGTLLGTFRAKEVLVGGLFSYDFSTRWSGGVRFNALYAHYEQYSAYALGVDLGLNYYDEEKGFSFSVLGSNLGGELKPFENQNESLPSELAIGFGKEFSYAPIRLSLTFARLTEWNDVGTKNSFGRKLLNHTVIGADIKPIQSLWLALGYNFLRANELSEDGHSSWAGLCAGAGLNLKRIKVGASYARYHTSSSSVIMNLSFTL